MVTPLEDQEVLERQTITLICEVSKPDEKAVWSKDGKEFTSSDRLQIRVDGTKHVLIIENAELADVAEYTIAFANNVSSSAKISITG